MLQDIQDFKDPQIHKLVRKNGTQDDASDLFGDRPPSALLSDYPLDTVGRERSVMMQQKFTDRRFNIARCWNQVQQYMPELLTSSPQAVLEVSTAFAVNCAAIEKMASFAPELLFTGGKRWALN